MALPNLSCLVRTAPIPTGMPLTSDKDWLEGMEAKRTFAHFRSLEAMEEHADRLNRITQTAPSLAQRARNVLARLEDRMFERVRSRMSWYAQTRVETLLDRQGDPEHARTIVHLQRAIRMLKRYKEEDALVWQAEVVNGNDDDDDDEYDDEELVSVLPSEPQLSYNRVDELVADLEDLHVRTTNAWYRAADEAIDEWDSTFEFQVLEHDQTPGGAAKAIGLLQKLRGSNFPLYVEMRRAAVARREALACSCEGLDIEVDEDLQRIDAAYRKRVRRVEAEEQVLLAFRAG